MRVLWIVRTHSSCFISFGHIAVPIPWLFPCNFLCYPPLLCAQDPDCIWNSAWPVTHHHLSGFYSSLFPVFSASLLLSSHFLFTCSIWSCSSHNKNKQKIHWRPHYLLHISSSLPYPSFNASPILIPCLSLGPLSAIQATGCQAWLHSNHRGLCPDPSDTVH